MRGAWLDSLSSKNSNKNSKKISKSIWTRSDPSGGGGLPSPLGGHRRPPAIFRHARPSLVAGHLSKAFFEVLEVLLLDVGVLSVFWSLFS